MANGTKKGRTKKKKPCPPGHHRVEIEAEPGTPSIDKETGKEKKKFECVPDDSPGKKKKPSWG